MTDFMILSVCREEVNRARKLRVIYGAGIVRIVGYESYATYSLPFFF